MIKHKEIDCEYWCLPGGGIEDNENPADASLRELKEECNVDGTIVRQTSIIFYSETDITYTYLVDIQQQIPKMGYDPEFKEDQQIINDLQWLSLKEISERDRCYLWSAGLLGIKEFINEVENWHNDISYPVG